MSEIRSSKRRPSEFDRAFATVRKAHESGRELRVDKKGNLKMLGFFGRLVLQYRVNRMSREGYRNYVAGERSATRTQVLKKLEGLAKQSRETAILGGLSGTTIGEDEKQQIEEHLSAYMERREAMRPALGGERTFKEGVTEEEQKQRKNHDLPDKLASTNYIFNLNALDLLKSSEMSMFVRKPVLPKGFNPDESHQAQLQHSTRTSHERRAHRLHVKSQKVHAESVRVAVVKPGDKIIDGTNFREDPGKFLLGSQGRVQFFDPDEDANVDEVIAQNETGAEDHVDQSQEAIKERKRNVDMSIYNTYEGGTNTAIYSGPNKVWNKADFRVQAGKRVASEIGRRGRFGKEAVDEGVRDEAVDFLCFLRKEVQKKFTGKGELPERFQAFFNENSAVSVPDSSTNQDRLVPSKKLARIAVNLCIGKAEGGTPDVAERGIPENQRPLAFSGVVGVREIPTSASEALAVRYAAANNKLELTTPVQKRKVFGMYDELLEVPVDEGAALDGVTEHYEKSVELPDDFEKFYPDGDPSAYFPGGPYSGQGQEAENQDGEIVPTRGHGREQPADSPEAPGMKWVNKQYASWSAKQRS